MAGRWEAMSCQRAEDEGPVGNTAEIGVGEAEEELGEGGRDTKKG